jgi:hypothetical protein
MSSRQSVVKRWIGQARKAGWRVESGGKHWRPYPPEKDQPPLTLPMSPGEGRALRNGRADLRRAGLEVDL